MLSDPVVILGSQAVGLSLALACARCGASVAVIDADEGALERAEVFARRDNPELADKIAFAPDEAALSSAALIFEALGDEDPTPFAAHVPKAAIVATSGTAEKWNGLVSPQQMVRLVPFQPMQLRSLTEIAAFPETSTDVLRYVESFARKIGRTPVTLPHAGRSVGLRLLDRLDDVAGQLLLEGAVLWELDEAMTAFGFDLGFYEAQDLTGLDVAYARRRSRGVANLIADRAVEEGRIGKKIGWGWYRYPGGGGAVIDPLIEDLIREEAWFSKTPQRSFSDAEMMARLSTALIAEAALILEDGGVLQTRDLDLIAIEGLGFPRKSGGILSYADQIGASEVIKHLEAAGEDVPAVLDQAARSGTPLVDYRGSAGG